MVLIACGNTHSSGEEVPVLEGTYRIVKVGDTQIENPDMIMTFIVEEDRMHGYAGCNNFSSGYEQHDSSVRFSRPISTKMYCDGKMEIEDHIFKVLDTISKIRNTNGQLELYSANESALITIRKQ